MRFEILDITPEIAQKILEKNVGHNRHLKDNHIDRLADAMSNGDWQLNAETIKISSAVPADKSRGIPKLPPELLDGQHRLHAIIRSNTTQQMAIAHDVDPSTFVTIDTGKNRSFGDILQTKGFISTAALASTVRLVAQFSTSNAMAEFARRTRGTSNASMLKTLEAHPEIAKHTNWQSYAKKVLKPSEAIFVAYILNLADEKNGYAFMQQLSEGYMLAKTDPMFTLREKLIELRMQGARVNKSWVIGSVFKVWNARMNHVVYDRPLLEQGEECPLPHGLDFKKHFGKEWVGKAVNHQTPALLKMA